MPVVPQLTVLPSGRRRRTSVLLVLAVLAALMLAGAATAASASVPHPRRIVTGHVRSFVPRRSFGSAGPTAATAPTTTVPLWRHTMHDGAASFQYAMVGRNVTVRQTSVVSTTVPTEVVPLILRFPDGHVFDPTVGDTCDSISAVTRTLSSPLFHSHTYSFGGVSVGSTQYVDAYQRANYYSDTKPTGINPGYHVLLSPALRAAVTISVPSSATAEGSMSCGSRVLGAVDVNWFDGYLRAHVIPALQAQGYGVTTLPLFLLGNVVAYDGTPGNCCILGFHDAVQTSTGIQTYAVADYDSSKAFPGSADVATLSHELAEWLADPLTTNATLPWGHVGQVSGCQANLEVGDPLSGRTISVVASSKTYHLQELAFTSWFFHEAPGTGVNGWYSSNGTFRSSAAACH